MNYATLIALLSAMSFSLPLLLKIEGYFGIERNDGILISLAIVIFLWVWLYLRWYSKIENESVRHPILPHEPYLPEIFYKDGEFQGEIYYKENNFKKALELYELYKIVLDRQGLDTSELADRIQEIKEINLVEDINENKREEDG